MQGLFIQPVMNITTRCIIDLLNHIDLPSELFQVHISISYPVLPGFSNFIFFISYPVLPGFSNFIFFISYPVLPGFSGSVIYPLYLFVFIQHPKNYGRNQNGELAHQADFLHNSWVDKVRSDSDHPHHKTPCGPGPEC